MAEEGAACSVIVADVDQVAHRGDLSVIGVASIQIAFTYYLWVLLVRDVYFHDVILAAQKNEVILHSGVELVLADESILYFNDVRWIGKRMNQEVAVAPCGIEAVVGAYRHCVHAWSVVERVEQGGCLRLGDVEHGV